MSLSWLRPGSASERPAFFAPAELALVRRFYESDADAPPTPLHHLRGLAAELGIGDLLAKDESSRFGLPAFKILGARYAVARLVGRPGPAPGDLACATAGNHGRAVAHAGRCRGLGVHVSVPAGTASARIAALLAEGADVTVTDVDYDATVRQMARDAAARGWTIVSDMAWEGYEEIPRWIMAGYTWLMEEAARQWGDAPPHIVIVQAGVGSLAGAVAGWLQASDVGRIGLQSAPTARPRLVTAEPIGSASVLASLRAGRRVTLEASAPTAMVGLRSAEVSRAAWPVLLCAVDAAIAVSDTLADEAMSRLAHPAPGDAAIDAGASGAAGLSALLALVREPALAPVRTSLGLGPATRVMVIVTEGRTDKA